jgi:hypothetical protein
VVGLRADERRQQRVVDVDDPVRVARAQVRAEHLHVPGQHDELDVGAVDQGGEPLLLRRLALRLHRQVVVGDAEEGARLGVVGVVARDEGDVGVQLAGAPAGQQVEQAVRLLAGQDGDAGQLLGEADLALHGEAVADLGPEARQHVVVGEREAVELELDALEEQPLVVVGVLVDLDDVRAVPVEPLGHCGDDPAGVGAGEQQHGGAGSVALARHEGRALAGRGVRGGHDRDPTAPSSVESAAPIDGSGGSR